MKLRWSEGVQSEDEGLLVIDRCFVCNGLSSQAQVVQSPVK